MPNCRRPGGPISPTCSCEACLFPPPRLEERPPSALRLTAPELEDILARADAASGRSPDDVFRLNEKLGWRMVALPGMEESLLRIKNMLGPAPEQGERTLPRLILILAGGQAVESSPLVSCEYSRPSSDGWQRIDLSPLHLYRRWDTLDLICEFQGSGAPEAKDQWLPSMLVPVYLRVIETGGAVLHAAAVERNGYAYLLPGKSGSGKSTCCGRIVPPWRVLCDDLALAVPAGDSGFLVHPLPTWSDTLWNGEEGVWHTERGFPLRGVFFLEHGERDESFPLGKSEASVNLWQAAMGGMLPWRGRLGLETRRSVEEQLFDTAIRSVKTIPAFRLRVARDGAFWKEMEEALARRIFPEWERGRVCP